MKIDSFQGEYRFLSNFSADPVEWGHLFCPTVEHAYQAAKTLDVVEQHRIVSLTTPGQAKRAGQRCVLRPDWETVKLPTMEFLVRQKFSRNVLLRERLIDTRDFYLEEGNTWGDRFWGVCRGVGENHLGKILMKVRGEFLGV